MRNLGKEGTVDFVCLLVIKVANIQVGNQIPPGSCTLGLSFFHSFILDFRKARKIQRCSFAISTLNTKPSPKVFKSNVIYIL